ncbi:large conductance mechanosensitive channel protein MscL [Cellulophaga sp. E16_2]|uniref:Large-conductance mechanosensitive channel n=1 Tax=Cellulophaga algicola (strain DSM 14237 / IC166 / ACAM 630) TaxID=688270 RepID=E6XFG0_CELAD|nr:MULTISPECIES: large conductance mechanosensitive channel protein MscL [Cellulophaga]ADV51433.1 Large-conductance mechanosensitive channel [Cellulophaga algicola DSM 14237]MBO0593806.1 large conductance mechanosensitive channel protein MscL [Cellulophaga sp. E16_2]
MKKFFQEFKSFAIKGNLIDIAVGVIIGAAFNNVVNVLVKKIIMPPLSLLTDGVNLHEKKYILRLATSTSDEVAIGYGELVEVLIDFVIVAFTIFIVVKGFNRFKTKAQDPKNKNVETPREIALLSSMEKLLQEQNELLKKK